jgi:hypothetical protein
MHVFKAAAAGYKYALPDLKLGSLACGQNATNTLVTRYQRIG